MFHGEGPADGISTSEGSREGPTTHRPTKVGFATLPFRIQEEVRERSFPEETLVLHDGIRQTGNQQLSINE